MLMQASQPNMDLQHLVTMSGGLIGTVWLIRHLNVSLSMCLRPIGMSCAYHQPALYGLHPPIASEVVSSRFEKLPHGGPMLNSSALKCMRAGSTACTHMHCPRVVLRLHR